MTMYGTPPIYCTDCGGKLVEERKQEGDKFDAFTGERVGQVSYVIRRCPRNISHDLWYSPNGVDRWVNP